MSAFLLTMIARQSCLRRRLSQSQSPRMHSSSFAANVDSVLHIGTIMKLLPMLITRRNVALRTWSILLLAALLDDDRIAPSQTLLRLIVTRMHADVSADVRAAAVCAMGALLAATISIFENTHDDSENDDDNNDNVFDEINNHTNCW